jgi:hypothetical protein
MSDGAPSWRGSCSRADVSGWNACRLEIADRRLSLVANKYVSEEYAERDGNLDHVDRHAVDKAVHTRVPIAWI